jgi:hypothetical protein
MARGKQGRDIYADDRDRKLWLATLGEACGKAGCRSTRAALSTSGREKRFPMSLDLGLWNVRVKPISLTLCSSSGTVRP